MSPLAALQQASLVAALAIAGSHAAPIAIKRQARAAAADTAAEEEDEAASTSSGGGMVDSVKAGVCSDPQAASCSWIIGESESPGAEPYLPFHSI